MIKFRQKEFIRYQPKEWDDILNLDRTKRKIIDLTFDSNKIGGGIYKNKIKRLKKDILDGYIYNNSPGNDSDDTEYLYQISDERIPNGFLIYSKNIAGDDRLCYTIYPPVSADIPKIDEVTENEVTEEVYIIHVHIYSCKGHKRPDGGDYWSPDPIEMRKIKQEINQWRKKRGLQEI